MLIKVYNDGTEVFHGSLSEFLADNDNDEELTEECKKLELQDFVEMSFYHSGEWRIERA